MLTDSKCLFCGENLQHTLVDLGMSPLCESYIIEEQLNRMEPFYPLQVRICANCFLVQLEEYVIAEIFLQNMPIFRLIRFLAGPRRELRGMVIARCGLNQTSQVVELASNDGYLLQYCLVRRHSGGGYRAGPKCCRGGD